jgi:EmrB/QacA subfamily drug resistance transporter
VPTGLPLEPSVVEPALSAPASTADPRRWKALSVLLLVQFMIILDVSVVNIALPAIQQDLGFSRAGLTWVVDSYVLVAGSLLLFGGRLGDVLGRRRMFLAGVAVFGVASLVCGIAQQPGTLVGARLAQGLGEALAAPAALGLIAVLFTDTAERVKAIGLFGGISGIAGTSGPIVSGALVEFSSWRWIFLINLPVALVALVVVPRLVDGGTGRSRAAGLDLRGALLVTAGLAGIVFGLIEAASHDWDEPRVLVPLLGGLVLLPLFALSQRTARDPLLPLSFLRERTRLATDTVALLFSTVFFAQFFVTTLYLQFVLGFGPLRTGLGFLPFGIAVGLSLGLATKLIPRTGLRPVLVSGLLLAAAGTLAFTRITADGDYLTQVLPASVLLALGSGLVLPALGNGAVHGVTDDDAGLASGVLQSAQQIGGAIGLAVLTTLSLRRAEDQISSGVDAAVATTDGYVLALQVGVVVLLVAAVVAAVGVRRGEGSTADPAARTAAAV